MPEISGKPTIHPALFITGKAAGYFAWLMLALALTGTETLHQQTGGLLIMQRFLR